MDKSNEHDGKEQSYKLAAATQLEAWWQITFMVNHTLYWNYIKNLVVIPLMRSADQDLLITISSFVITVIIATGVLMSIAWTLNYVYCVYFYQDDNVS